MSYGAAFPHVQVSIEDQLGEDYKVVSRFVATATQTGPIGKIPPSGKRATVSGVFIDRFANGKIVETWSNFDALGLLAQLGVLPVPKG